MELTEAFYEHLLEHAVPLDEQAIARLKGSSLALDLYVWLCYRLPRLERPARLSFAQLVPQFGSQICSVASFAQNLREVLLDVLAVYPGARVELVPGGDRAPSGAGGGPSRAGGRARLIEGGAGEGRGRCPLMGFGSR